MYKYLYLILKKRLLDQVPELQQVEWYFNQERSKGAVRVTPAVYIRFQPVDTRQLGNGIQEGNIQFDVILFTESLLEGDTRLYPVIGPEHLEITQKIYIALSGFSAMLSYLDEYQEWKDTETDWRVAGTISRSRIEPPGNQGKLLKSIQSFRTYAKDYTARPEYKQVEGPVSVEINIE